MDKKKELKEYTVNVVYSMVHTMYVEASSPDEAKATAMERFNEEPDFSDDEVDEVLRANIVYDPNAKTYPVRYRGCYRNGRPNENDPKVGRVEYWPMEKILDEINNGRSDGWTPYTEKDWKEGLDEWTEWVAVDEDLK